MDVAASTVTSALPIPPTSATNPESVTVAPSKAKIQESLDHLKQMGCPKGGNATCEFNRVIA